MIFAKYTKFLCCSSACITVICTFLSSSEETLSRKFLASAAVLCIPSMYTNSGQYSSRWRCRLSTPSDVLPKGLVSIIIWSIYTFVLWPLKIFLNSLRNSTTPSSSSSVRQFSTRKGNRVIVLNYYCSQLVLSGIHINFKGQGKTWIHKHYFACYQFFYSCNYSILLIYPGIQLTFHTFVGFSSPSFSQ